VEQELHVFAGGGVLATSINNMGLWSELNLGRATVLPSGKANCASIQERLD